jgi:protocatechuate 3,4-dioxygenase beta subunit
MLRRRHAAVGFAALLALALLISWRLGRHRDRGEAGIVSSQGAAGEVGPHGQGAHVDGTAARPAAIEGTVRDMAGSPIPSAHVCGSAFSASAFHDADDDVGGGGFREPTCATTGVDGRFRLDGLLPGPHSVIAGAPRFIPGRYRDARQVTAVRLAPGETRTGIDITLQPGGVEVSGTVKDIGGGPIEGAWVRARMQARPDGAAARARSLADGSFRLWVAPGNLDLVAQADGYADGWRRSTAPAQSVEILLTPGSSLSGRVVDVGTGRAVAGARVSTVLHRKDSDPDSLSGSGVVSVADDDGRFRFTRLAPGRYKPAATSPGGYGEARESVLLGLGQSADGVVIELHPAQSVNGRVVVAGDDAPCAEGLVHLDEVDGARFRHETIDADGRVSFGGILPGRYRVSVTCAGIDAASAHPDVVVVADAPTAEERWVVGSTKATIRGTVRSASGPPVAHATVQVERVATGASVTVTIGPTGSIAGSLESDGRLPDELTLRLADRATGFSRSERFFRTAGQFVLRDLPSGSFNVSVKAVEGTAAAQAQLAAGQDLTGLVIRLAGRARVTGRLVAFDGSTPLAGYFILVSERNPLGGFSYRYEGVEQPRSGSDGRFVLEGAPSGRVRIGAYSGLDDSPHGGVDRPATLAPGNNDLGDLRASPEPGARIGDLGFELAPFPQDADPTTASPTVAAIRPDGPAAKSDLRAGDTIVSIDGNDLRDDSTSYHELSMVPPGTTVTLGLGRGASVRITAAESR